MIQISLIFSLKKKVIGGSTWKQKYPFVEVLEEKKFSKGKIFLKKFHTDKTGKYNPNMGFLPTVRKLRISDPWQGSSWRFLA